MKRNLFLKAAQSLIKKGKINSTFFKLILLTFLGISSFFNAAALEPDFLVQVQKDTIFSSNGVEIHGEVFISNARIFQVATVSTPKSIQKTKIQSKQISLAKQVIAKENNGRRDLKLLQEKINKKVKKIFYTSTTESELLKLAQQRLASSAIFISISSYDFSNALISDSLVLNICKTQTLKQKFYTSLSYTLFGKFRSSSVRGPPQQSI